MRRLVVLLASLALLAAGCGGGGKAQSHSVLEVSKAFYDAGLPFTGVVTGNQYVTGQEPFLPLALNQSDMHFNVQAQLSGSNTSFHTGEVVSVLRHERARTAGAGCRASGEVGDGTAAHRARAARQRRRRRLRLHGCGEGEAGQSSQRVEVNAALSQTSPLRRLSTSCMPNAADAMRSNGWTYTWNVDPPMRMTAFTTEMTAQMTVRSCG